MSREQATNAVSPTPTRQAETRVEIDGLDSSGLSGVSCEGGHVWYVDQASNHLVAVDAVSGEVARRLTSVKIDSGLTFDGKHLWGGCGERILRIDPASGEVDHSIEVPAGGSGLAWAEGALWMGRCQGQQVLKLDPETGEVLATIDSDRMVTGVTWVDGELWHACWNTLEGRPDETELRRVDTSDGRVLERIAFDDAFPAAGIEADGEGGFWVGDSFGGRLRAVKSSHG